jgi:hypothetical protein
VSWRALDPTPFRAWIRWAPRNWPGAEVPYVDLADAHIVWPGEATGAGGLPERPPPEPDVVYLPPVAEDRRAERVALARRLVEGGCALLLQDVEGGARTEIGGAIHWLDPLASLLSGGESAISRQSGDEDSRARGALVLPLAPGLTPSTESLSTLLERARQCCETALPVPLDLDARDRRRLVDRLGEEAFDGAFHGRSLPEREAARAVAEAGLRALPERPPLAALPPRATRNRDLASRLVLAGELWLRLGRSEGEGVALLASARRIETTHLDAAALVREGNQMLLDLPSATARRVVEEELSGAPASLAAELLAAWTGGDGT